MEPDFNSPTWLWVVEQLRAEQTLRRAELEARKGFDETNVLRGQLLTIKVMLALPDVFKRQREDVNGLRN